jgi:hypothetical protein
MRQHPPSPASTGFQDRLRSDGECSLLLFAHAELALLDEAGVRPVAFRTAPWTDESARARQP